MIREDLKRLIVGAQGGNAEDIEALAARFNKMIKVGCSLRLDDSDLIEDAAQEVTEQLLSGISQLKSPEAFTAWLETIIVRTCMRANRRNRERQVREIGLDTDEQTLIANRLVEQDISSLPEASFDLSQSRQQMLFYIQQLPQAQRIALILHYFGMMSYRQIAEVLNIKTGTVSSNIAKGKQNLSQLLLRDL